MRFMWQSIRRRPGRVDFCDSEEDGGAVHRCLHAIMHFIEDHAKEAEIPVRFAASKLAEGDVLIRDSLKLDENEKETLEHIICTDGSRAGAGPCSCDCAHAV